MQRKKNNCRNKIINNKSQKIQLKNYIGKYTVLQSTKVFAIWK